jgi:hypothetical protein
MAPKLNLVATVAAASAAVVVFPAALSASTSATTNVVSGVICVAPAGDLNSPTNNCPVEMSVPPFAQSVNPLKLASRLKLPSASVVFPESVSQLPFLSLSAHRLAPETYPSTTLPLGPATTGAAESLPPQPTNPTVIKITAAAMADNFSF